MKSFLPFQFAYQRTLTTLALIIGLVAITFPAYGVAEHYLRIMGMNIGTKNYDDPAYQKELSRLSWVILGFYPGWRGQQTGQSIGSAVSMLKRLNSQLAVGQYTNVMEAYDEKPNLLPHNDKAKKLTIEHWWLNSSKQGKLAWTDQYGTYLTNFTSFAQRDQEGNTYAEWLAARDAAKLFNKDNGFDIWYFDNVDTRPKIRWADWDNDGRDEDGFSEKGTRAYREGFREHWRTARALRPGVLLIGNVTSHDLSAIEYRGELNGVFLEALAGASWSLMTKEGWQAVVQRYFAVRQNLAEPRLVGFNVIGEIHDYHFMRFMLATCLLGDGYFSYTDRKVGYSSVPWFDEFDVPLGNAIDPPQLNIWQDGVYRRRFEGGLVLVNPQTHPASVEIEPGYRRTLGKQDPTVNDGTSVRKLVLPAESGLVLVRE